MDISRDANILRLYLHRKTCLLFLAKYGIGKIDLSEIGEMAHNSGAGIPAHFPFVKLDEFVVMPDHMHGNYNY